MTAPVFITRDPVLNKQRAIVGNRLTLFAASAALALQELDYLKEHWPAKGSLFLNFGRLPMTESLASWEMPANTVLEVDAVWLTQPAGAKVLGILQERNQAVALYNYQPGQPVPGGLRVQFVMLDARQHPSPGANPGLAIATQVADNAEFEALLHRGYDGVAGWAFTRREIANQKLAPGYAQVIRLIDLLRKRADVKEIEAAFKLDVTLSYKLLRFINSAAFGLASDVTSFRHAVTLLGYDKLYKWLSLLLVTASKEPITPVLMQAAVARGRFMESLGKSFFDASELDNLFITGAFSLLDLLLDSTMESILEQMHPPGPIRDALLKREGMYAPLLKLATACEGLPGEMLSASKQLGLTPTTVNRAQLEALSFADSLKMAS